LHIVGGDGPRISHLTTNVLNSDRTTTGGESRIAFNNTVDGKAAQMRINWAQDSFGAFETWVPISTSNGQVISFRSSIDNTIFYGSVASTERARIDSSGRLLVGTSSDSGGALLQVNGNRIRIATANTPASAGATGTTGEIAWDADYIYVCTATNTWKRTAISTW
jgi:hypothetical protein